MVNACTVQYILYRIFPDRTQDMFPIFFFFFFFFYTVHPALCDQY